MSHAVEVCEGGGHCAEAWPALRDLGAVGRRALGLVTTDALSAHRHVEELTAFSPFVAFVFWGGARFGEELHGVAEAWVMAAVMAGQIYVICGLTAKCILAYGKATTFYYLYH